MRQIRDIKDQKFNKLTAKRFIKIDDISKSAIWLFQCDCGNYIQRRGSDVTKNKSKTKSCGCLLKEVASKKFNIINAKSGKDHPQFTGYKDIAGCYISSIKCRARKLNIQYNLSNIYLWNLFEQQNRKCKISGIDIILCDSTKAKRNNKDLQTASLDRIDSTKGYIEGNVQWVHKTINKMKLNMTDKQLINWCIMVVNNNV